jgi:hypothetical protein
LRRAVIAVVLIATALPAPALAAFPGQNGKIAFVGSTGFQTGIATVNPDGSERTQLTSNSSDLAPTWSPDGTRIAFMRERPEPCDTDPCGYDTWVMNADGSGAALAIPDAWSPTWSPRGDKIAFMARVPNFDWSLWVANTDGSERTQIFAPPDITELGLPAWSPSGQEIAFQYDGPPEVFCEFDDCVTFHPMRVGAISPAGGSMRDIDYGLRPAWSPNGSRIAFVTATDHDTTEPPGYIGVMNADGSARQLLADGGNPAWSPDGTKIVFSGLQVMNSDGSGRTTVGEPQIGGLDPDWQPIPYPGYARPKSAPSVRVSLVPAFTLCTSPNREHGPPLAYGSCNPPAPESGELTLGTGAEGFVRYRAVVGSPATLADDADIAVRVQISDVREPATSADYAGAVRAESIVRIVDRGSGGPATVVDVLFPLLTQCTPTQEETVGSDCSLNTTLDALIPDAIAEGRRTVLQVDQVSVADGGPDADPWTEPNTVLLRQGVFVP